MQNLPTEPALSNRAIKLELLAVLSVTVLPWVCSAILTAINGPSITKPPFWIESVDAIVRNVCLSFAVLYLMSRSGEPWATYGLARPNSNDLYFGLILLVISYGVVARLSQLLPSDSVGIVDFFAKPTTPLDKALMVPMFLSIGIIEELVMRAYLITRLEHLLKSPLNAVLISTVIFASYHIYYRSGKALFIILLLGLLYGGLFVLQRRIWPFAIAHALVDYLIEIQNSLH